MWSASAFTPATRCAATRLGRIARERGAWVVFGGIHATLLPGRAARTRGRTCGRQGGRRYRVGAGGQRLRGGCAANRLRRRQGRRRLVPAGALGSDSAQQVHVGVGADGARLPEALLVLLGVAHRRPEAAAARRRRRHCGDRRAAAPRLPLHRAGRRQLLSGDAHRHQDGARRADQSQRVYARGAARGALRADGAARAAARAT